MRSEAAQHGAVPNGVALKRTARTQGHAMSLTKPMLGLAVGGTLGLLGGPQRDEFQVAKFRAVK
jgi:hypothetical protein